MALDALRDGYVRLCFDPSLNVVGERCRVVLEGQMAEPGSATPDVLRKITSLRDVETLFGVGSIMSESLKVAFDCCANGAVEIYALPREDAEAAVAAQYTMTFTGPATSDGRIDIYWGEARYNISVRVREGDAVTDIAAAVAAAYAQVPGFPFTAVAAAGVITFTARNAGTAMNCFALPAYNWQNRNDYAPQGVTFVAAQTVQGATNPAPLDYKNILGECCVCCYGVLSDDEVWQQGVIDYIADAWACDKPQCFGHSYTYNTGTLGQVLAADTNSAEISRLDQCCDDPILGWMKVAAYATKSCCETVDNPELSIQGPQFGVLECVRQPESCGQCRTFDEQEQLREAGFVITVPLQGGEGSLTSPMVTNDITNNRYDIDGRENLTFRDVSARRLAKETAEAFAIELQKYNGLGLYTRNTDIREGVRGTNPRLLLGGLRAWAKSQVGILFSEFDDLDKDLTVQTDFQRAPKCLGVPGLIHVNLVYRPPVRMTRVIVNMQPKLLDNC